MKAEKRDDIELPCLYDTTIRTVRDGVDVEPPRHYQGLYDYDRNVFKLPRKYLKLFQHRRTFDYGIMQDVGLEIVD